MMSLPPRLNSGGPANWSPTQQAMRKMPLPLAAVAGRLDEGCTLISEGSGIRPA